MLACQYLVHIPANPEFTSLNLAQAVQVVAYELFMASGSVSFEEKKEQPATVDDLEGLYAHLERAAIESKFFDPAASWAPEQDFERCTALDRFDFVLRLGAPDADGVRALERIDV